MKVKNPFYVGTAGWTIPKANRGDFFQLEAKKPNHLVAYSQHLTAVEINSSFYREHQGKTYSKWAQSTPDSFRFSIKLAKRFTHVQKLSVDSTDLARVLDGIQQLGEKLGVILIQLPPKLAFDARIGEEFFATIRELYTGGIAFEPRHVSWAGGEATKLLDEYEIAQVVADPDRIGDAPPIRSAKLAYFRLHGSPRVYYDAYDKGALDAWTKKVAQASKSNDEVWCIFDNTALGFATGNALTMLKDLKPVSLRRKRS